MLHRAVIIGNSFNNTLGLIRSLGEAKIEIILLLVGSSDRLYVKKSRYLKKSQVFQVSTLEDCMPILQKISDNRLQQIIICTYDQATQYIDAHETDLCHKFITPMGGKQLGDLMNKDQQCQLAAKCGIRVPQSLAYSRGSVFPNIAFPLLLKPLNSTRGEKSDIHICHNNEELSKALSETSRCDKFVIQEFIQKEYEINLIGVSTDYGVFIPGGIKKIRHYPTIYSPCSFGIFQSVKTLDIDVHRIIKMFQKIKYRGPFSVEFLHKDNKNYFMEVNFRHDGLAYAATASGVNLPMLLFKSLPMSSEVKDTYMMDLSIDYCHVKDGTVSRVQWLSDLLKTRCQLNFCWHDPIPTICYYFNKLKHRLAK